MTPTQQAIYDEVIEDAKNVVRNAAPILARGLAAQEHGVRHLDEHLGVPASSFMLLSDTARYIISPLVNSLHFLMHKGDHQTIRWADNEYSKLYNAYIVGSPFEKEFNLRSKY